MGKIVFTTSFCGVVIRVIKFEDKLWFLSADLRKALGMMHGGSFCEKAPEEMKRCIEIAGHQCLKRIISPEGLMFLADKAVRGKIYRHKVVIKKFIAGFLEEFGNRV